MAAHLLLGREAIEALCGLLRTRQGHIAYRPRNPAIAVVERGDGHEPQVRQTGLEHGVYRLSPIEPLQEGRYFGIERMGWRGLVIHFTAALSGASGLRHRHARRRHG